MAETPKKCVFCVSTKSLSTKSSPRWKEIHFQGKCFFQENSRNDHSILFRREFKVKKGLNSKLPNAQRNGVFFCVCLFEKDERCFPQEKKNIYIYIVYETIISAKLFTSQVDFFFPSKRPILSIFYLLLGPNMFKEVP